MRSLRLSTMVLATLSLSPLTRAHSNASLQTSQYTLTDNLTYENFFPNFSFFSEPDPTHGFVQYANLSSAISQRLAGYLPHTQSVFLGVDATHNASSTGRASVRLESNQNWTQGLLIADIRHMPAEQCGVWPAFWLVSASQAWPDGGEIDILEGVNDAVVNAVSLHTARGCVVDNSSSVVGGSTDGNAGDANHTSSAPMFSGTMLTTDCDVDAIGQTKNAGCSIRASEEVDVVYNGSARLGAGDAESRTALLPSYGTRFNSVQGGVYAMEWTETGISVWLFPRDSEGYNAYFPHVNASVAAPDPAAWGPPLARFSGAGCDFAQRFRDMKIVVNTAFCGDWAGREWNDTCRQKTGVETCEDYVRDHPEAFSEAYWEIRGLWWWQ